MAAPFFFFFAIGHIVRDVKPVNDSDLRFSATKVAPRDNAFFELAKIDLDLSENDRSFVQESLKGETWDAARAERLVKKAEPSLQHFEAAAKRPTYQDPAVFNTDDPNHKMPNMLGWNDAGQLMLLDSLLLERSGRSKTLGLTFSI